MRPIRPSRGRFDRRRGHVRRCQGYREGQGGRDPGRAGGARAGATCAWTRRSRISASTRLGLVEAVFAIEEAFDIQVPFNANDPQKSEFDISTVDDHGAGRGEPDRGPEIACRRRGSSSPARARSTPSAGPRPRPWPRCARAAPASAPLEFPDVERLSIAIGGQIRGYRPEDAFRPPGADALRPVHPVRAPRRARGDGAVGPRDHRGARASARAWCSAPRAAGCRPRTRTTGWSTRRGRTGCIPSWCRG